MYKVQILQYLQTDDGPRRAAFATEILQWIDNDNKYLQCVCLLDVHYTSGSVYITKDWSRIYYFKLYFSFKEETINLDKKWLNGKSFSYTNLLPELVASNFRIILKMDNECFRKLLSLTVY